MKIIKYTLRTIVNRGTEEAPLLDQVLSSVEMGWNPTNEEIAKRESFNGEYIIEEVPDVEPDMQNIF